jgi:hypothetical protein
VEHFPPARQHRRIGAGEVRADEARTQPLRVKDPGNGTHSETSTETAVVLRSLPICS